MTARSGADDEAAARGAASSASLARGSDAELRGWIELALAAADEADTVALGHFRRDVEVTEKPDRTLVTAADVAIEERIRTRIRSAHPDHGLVGEEYGSDAADAPTRWYVDPIDGTHNFVRGVPVFASLIAVERDGELQAAVVSAPALRERWFAWRGGGAWAVSGDGARRRLRVSKVARLADAQVLYGDGRQVVASGLAPGFDTVLAAAWRERGFGDFWGYMLVAEGAAEVMLEVGLHPWDAAAPLVVVEEAGGRATDLEGERAIGSGAFLATNGIVHEDIRRRLTATGD